MALLSELHLYPIKSAQGIRVTETPVEISGPPVDRRWMLVDDNGTLLTQRDHPRMAFLRTTLTDDAILVEAPELEPLHLPRTTESGERIRTQIWDDVLLLPSPDPAYDAWFSRFLGRSCRLVHLPESIVRPVESPFDEDPWRVSLADAYPLLVISEGSLADLNQRLDSPVTMMRFRPNLVVTGVPAFAEDRWRKIRIGDVELAVVKPCARCALTLVDPVTAEKGIEPLRTLNTYRKTGSKVMFGQNVLVTKPGILRAGTSIEILEERGDLSAAENLVVSL